jgi:hypothetical protein
MDDGKKNFKMHNHCELEKESVSLTVPKFPIPASKYGGSGQLEEGSSRTHKAGRSEE